MKNSLPDAAVIVPNWNGRAHLDACFRSLDQLAYAGRVEFVLVDNGSKDDSVAWIERQHPRVRVLRNRFNEGFAKACNDGVRAVDADVVAFVNNDMRVDPSWLSGLVEGMNDEYRCTGSLILSFDGREVNYGGGGMNFHGLGIQLGLGSTDVDRYREPGDTLFACGGGMAIDRRLFLDAGGFDERYFAYYEDVDLGWRLWVLGQKVRYCPASVAYHHHSATSSRVDVHRIRRLQVRNPLFTIFKNYDDDNLKRALPAALLISLRRTKYMLAANESGYSLEWGRGMRGGPFASLRSRILSKRFKARVARAGVADVLAYNDLLDGFATLVEERRSIQSRRARPDVEIVGLFRDPFWTAEKPAAYAELQDDLCRFFGLDEVLGRSSR